jgi:predicted metal-dependent phosphoesterase TrpH
LIDLHTHTTASDGRCTPAELAERASAAGVTVLSVTDHDTLAGCHEAAAACSAARIEFVPGIEITSVVGGRDVHVLGYFIDLRSAALGAFLATQRALRVERVREMIERLAAYGIVLDAAAILAPALKDSTTSAGRPWIARALVDAKHVASTDEAFAKWLDRGRPAFVPRSGPSPAEVFERVHDANGLVSLAHPVLVSHDEWLTGFSQEGLDALEAYHSDHDAATTRHYLALADRLGLLVTGGSDYHGDPSHGPAAPGSVSLPSDAFARLKARSRATSPATAPGSSTPS